MFILTLDNALFDSCPRSKRLSRVWTLIVTSASTRERLNSSKKRGYNFWENKEESEVQKKLGLPYKLGCQVRHPGESPLPLWLLALLVATAQVRLATVRPPLTPASNSQSTDGLVFWI